MEILEELAVSDDYATESTSLVITHTSAWMEGSGSAFVHGDTCRALWLHVVGSVSGKTDAGKGSQR